MNADAERHTSLDSPWVREQRTGPEFVSIDDLARRVLDGDVVSPGGFHFTRVPVQLLQAIAGLGRRNLAYVQWGGGLGLEILLEAGCVSHVVFCFSNLDVFGTAPNFRSHLESQTVSFDEITALELHHALLARAMNLRSLPMQAPLGSWRAPAASNGDVISAPQVPIDVVLLHALRADQVGNIEVDGSQGLDRTLAFASRRVLATVEEVVPTGSLSARAAVIPRQFVDAIALAPGGAWPTSCMPIYGPDYSELARRVGSKQFRRSTPPGVPDEARSIATTSWASRAWPTPGTSAEIGPAEQMIVWLSRQLDNDSVCSVGATSPLATIAYLVAKCTHAPRLTLITHNGGYVDVASRFVSLSMAEASDYQTAAVYCGGDDSYRWFYQQGRVTHEVVGAAQIDMHGRTNNRWIRRSDGTRVRLPGQGGMADVANMHRNFILYATRQSSRQLVLSVDEPSASRAILLPAERARLGYGAGEVQLVTNLGAFVLDPSSGTFRLSALHPGVQLDQVDRATGFPVEPRNVNRSVAPTEDELNAINRVDPFGIRNLEFVPTNERLALIQDIIERECAFVTAA